MDTEKQKKFSQDQSLSSMLEKEAISQMRRDGIVSVHCPRCGTVPKVEITGMYKQRVRVRCECGFLSCTELGI